ncbi:MAG: hypothetical protein A3F35_03340 [Candidatus Woykebacteria bacterium RIFCSPHIGHO2_12_FULL_45_10]|uniref:Uncharacterized protein n=1 Tax=Candidatus Woykebacteria bacterium RIFCSPHIGHO2_12_FULL_45_10 TaxID=1802603 RepID=A0A1G1WQU5_9BACT|nr:MAG: hypothetical protein A3F35_03340 [Candidatus Woykebacteria bacterium RIFCSPHIGHO2_12_FULL_45_10]
MTRVDINLQEEVKLLRSFVIGIAGKDEEGEYNPEFVGRILRALKENADYKFSDSKTFLDQIQKTN